MSEFGHFGKIMPGVGCIDAWGAGPFVIEAAGKSWRFEDSDRFGPYIINRRGDITNSQPGPRSPFWHAHRAWREQGRKVADDGVTCVYEPLPPLIIRHMGGRHYKYVSGDIDAPETIRLNRAGEPIKKTKRGGA